MTSAIFGLLGVVVGGVLNGLVARWQARRTTSDEVRAAARMLLHHVLVCSATAGVAVTSKEWPRRQFWIAPRERWQEYERLMASALVYSEWIVLDKASRSLLELDTSSAAPGAELDDEALRQLQHVDDKMTEALHVLHNLAARGPHPTVRFWLKVKRRKLRYHLRKPRSRSPDRVARNSEPG